MRKFIATIFGRALALSLCTALLALTSCIPTVPLSPVAGLPAFQNESVVELGHAGVNLAGGNMIFKLPPMVVDTPLGPQSFGATYNAADGEWTWSYYGLSYHGKTFVDPTGMRNSLDYLNPYGRLMPANGNWMPLNSRKMKSAGGMVYEFRASTGELEAIYRSSADYTRLKILPNEIQQCSDALTCSALFEVGRDGAGRIVTVKDRPGPEQRTAEFSYDASGRLSIARSAGDVQVGRAGFRFQYSLAMISLITSTTNSENEEVQYSYDLGRRLTHVQLVGTGDPTTQLVYGNVDDLAFTRVIDPLGNEQIYRHDGYRQLREHTDGEGWTTFHDWSGLRRVKTTTPAGVVTSWLHSGDTTIEFQPSGNQVTTTYLSTAVNLNDPWAQAVVEVSDLDDQGAPRTVRQNTYDPAGVLSSTADGNGETLLFAFTDGLLYTAYVPNPTGGTPIALLRDVHGPHGHPTEIGYWVASVPVTQSQSFTSAGDPTSGPSMAHANAEGRPNTRLLHYDDDRNLSAIDYGRTPQSEPADGTTTFTRRSDGRPLLISRPMGDDAEFVYDGHGRLAERKDRVGGVWQSILFSRDTNGWLTSLTTPNGMQVAIEYDSDGRQTRKTWTKPGTTTMVRDTSYALSRVVSILDSTRGALQSLEYDAAGRLSASNYPLGERIEIAYDERDRVTQQRLIFPDLSENLLEAEYDGAGNWDTLKLDGVVFSDRTTVAGSLHKLAFGHGATRVERQSYYSYGQGGRMIATQTKDALGATLELTDILKADGFNITKTIISSSIELPGGPVGISEVLWERGDEDLLGLKVWGEGEFEVLPGTPFPEQLFFYDQLGNQLDVGIVYNSDNTRLQSAFGFNYTSDASGYVDQIDDPTAGTSTVIVRNAQGRAIEIQQTGQAAIPINRDTWGRPLPNLFGGRVEIGPSGGRSYELGVVRLDLDASGCHLGRYFDFRGNVRFTVDLCSGLPQKAFEYGAYGVAAQFGSDGDDRSFAQGRELASDLMLVGSRLYQPSIGRFLSPDPVFQAGSQFGYAEGNPVKLWDPDGRNPIILAAIAAVALVLAAWGSVVIEWALSSECECGDEGGGGEE